MAKTYRGRYAADIDGPGNIINHGTTWRAVGTLSLNRRPEGRLGPLPVAGCLCLN